MTDKPQCLDDLGEFPQELEWRRHFVRYHAGGEDSVWICQDCGLVVANPDHGCEHCGLGTDPDDPDEAEWPIDVVGAPWPF